MENVPAEIAGIDDQTSREGESVAFAGQSALDEAVEHAAGGFEHVLQAAGSGAEFEMESYLTDLHALLDRP